MHLFYSTWFALAATGGFLPGQPPPGYYATVDTTSAATLRVTLHAVIDDHLVFPYTSGATDTWDILEDADEDPANSSRIVDIYLNESYSKQGGGNSFYNREHSWPKSYGFPDPNSSGPYTDCHSLRLVNDTYNSLRSNKPFDDCDAGCDEETTVVTNGTGGGSGTFPGNSNWTEGAFTAGSWQVWAHRKGDLARSMLYLDIRYEGGTHGGTSAAEPDLILTDDRQLIANSNTGQEEAVAYMGILSTLVQWHWDDPPDADEIARNNAVASYQGNRNPFVDHPEWVDVIWGGGPGGPIPGSFARYGSGCPHSGGGTPTIGEVANPLIGQNLTFLAFGGPPSAPTAIHVDFAPSAINLGIIGFPACDMLALPTLAITTATSGAGIAFLSVPIANDPGMVGSSWYAQYVFLEFVVPTVSATGGAQFTFGSP